MASIRARTRVEHVNATKSLVTIRRADGDRVTYDPRRLQGVTLYQETTHSFIATRSRTTAARGRRPIAFSSTPTPARRVSSC
jgi:hypothetical protein